MESTEFIKSSGIKNGHEKSPYSSPKEEILRSGKPESSKEILGGIIGDATFIKIKDDGAGVFKPHRGSEGKERQDFLGRERAAYLIDLFLGFNFVPPTIIRTMGDLEEDGSFQEFVENAQIAGSVDLELLPPDEIAKLIIFDAIIGNTDRNLGNFLIRDGVIHAIDHGLSLEPFDLVNSRLNFNKSFDHIPKRYNDIDGELPVKKIPNSIIDNLRAFEESPTNQNILRELLSEVLDKQDVELILRRILAFARSIDESGEIHRERFKEQLKQLTKQ